MRLELTDEYLKKLELNYESHVLNSENYTDQPTGSLDVDRLLNGHTQFWKTSGLTSSIIKKKLVITDWSIAYSQTIRSFVQSLIEKLLKQGFTIYTWQNQLIELTTSSLAEDLIKVMPAHRDEIIRALCQYNVPADQVEVLDYFKTRSLWIHFKKAKKFLEHDHQYGKRIVGNAGFPKESNTLYLGDLAKVTSDLFKAIISSMQGVLSINIMINTIDASTLTYLKYFIKLNYPTKLLIDYSTKEIFHKVLATNVEFLDAIREYYVDLSDLNSAEQDFIKLLFDVVAPKLVKLHLRNSDLSDLQISDLIKQTPNLNALSFESCQKISGNFTLPLGHNLNNLKLLKFLKINIDEQKLNEFIVRCPNLQWFYIYECRESFTGKFLSRQLMFSHMKGLALGCTAISADGLSTLLVACPNLRYLDLYSYKQTEKLHLPPDFQLNKLKWVYLVSAEVSDNFLTSLLAHCPNLKSLIAGCNTKIDHDSQQNWLKMLANNTQVSRLELDKVNIFLTVLSKNMFYFNSIKKLFIKDENVNFEDLEKLLTYYPSLKELELSNCKNLHKKSYQQLPKLSLLQKLVLNQSTITAKAMAAFLVRCENLSDLTIMNCKNIDDEFILPENLQLNIKKCYIASCTISSQLLSTILIHTTNLNELTISNNDQVKNVILPEELKLKITRLSIKYTFNEQVLATLLQHCPDLEYLNIRDNKDLYGKLLLEKKWKLAQLKTLEADSSSINDKMLSRFLENSPNLERLCLSECKLITGNELCFKSELQKLSYLDLQKISINKEGLISLLSQSPNLKTLYCPEELLGFSYTDIIPALKSLEVLNTSSAKFGVDFLNKMLCTAPNIKSLILPKYDFSGELALPQKLLKIVELDLTQSSINKEQLIDLLIHCPSLETLILNFCDFISGDFNFPNDFKLTKLKTLHLRDSSISLLALLKLLSCSPQLQWLDIENNPQLFFGDSSTALNTSIITGVLLSSLQLNHIDLTSCGISDADLKETAKKIGIVPELLHLRIKNTKKIIVDEPGDPNYTGKSLYEGRALRPYKANQENKQEFKNWLAKAFAEHNLSKNQTLAQLLSSLKPSNKKFFPDKTESTFYYDKFPYDFDTNNPTTRSPSIPALDSHTARDKGEHQLFLGEESFRTKEQGLPNPSHYRFKVFSQLHIMDDQITLIKEDADIESLTTLYPEKINLNAIYQKHYEKGKKCFYGEKYYRFASQDWQQLPTLSPKDEIIYMCPSYAIELGYCHEQSSYYIRPADSHTLGELVNIKWIVESDLEKYAVKSSFFTKAKKYADAFSGLEFTLDDFGFFKDCDLARNASYFAIAKLSTKDKIRALATFCQSFHEEKLSSLKDNSGINILNAIIKEKKGTCRHRAFAFMAIAQAFAIPTRVIFSEFHVFIEIFYKMQWRKLDLGPTATLENKYQLLPPEKLLQLTENTQDSALSPDLIVGDVASNTIKLTQPNSSHQHKPLPPIFPDQKDIVKNSIIIGDPHLLRRNKIQKPPKKSKLSINKLIKNTNKAAVSVSPGTKTDIMAKSSLGFYDSKPSKGFALNDIKNINQNPFATWFTHGQDKINTFKEYGDWLYSTMHIFPKHKRNILLIFSSNQQIELFNAALMRYLLKHNGQHFYLSNLDKIVTKSLQVDEQNYRIIDSTLINFIKHAKTDDVLLINWSDYKPAYVGFNTTMDEDRKLEEFPIAPGVINIGIIEETMIDKLGEDFYSRFSVVTSFSSNLEAEINDEQHFSPPVHKDGLIAVNLYDSNRWQEELIGSFSLQGKQLVVKPGALTLAVTNNLAGLEIQNGQWQEQDFRLFYTELLIKKCFYFNGNLYQLPKDFSIVRTTNPYTWESAATIVALSNDMPDAGFCLNAYTYPLLFESYYYQDQQIYIQPGLLARHAKQIMKLWITATLSEGAWARLLDAATANHCQLKLYIAAEAKLPKGLEAALAQHIKAEINGYLHQSPPIPAENTVSLETVENILAKPVTLISSDDSDFTAAYLKKLCHFDLELHIAADTKCIDLIENIQCEKISLPFSFKYTQGVLWEALEKGQVVLIKGTFNSELAGHFSHCLLSSPALWVNGQLKPLNGKLIIVTSEKKAWSAAAYHYRHASQESDYWQWLAPLYPPQAVKNLRSACMQLQKINQNLQWSFIQIKTLHDSLEHETSKNPFPSLFWLNERAPELVRESNNIWYSLMQQQFKQNLSSTEIEDRIGVIANSLKNNPYVFMVGPSGSGKSTLVLNHLLPYYTKQQQHIKIFVGIKQLKDWASSQHAGLKILFLDEANLSAPESWDKFEGLFNQTVGLIIEGKFFPLTSQHRIIFAGNFTYYNGRNQHAFFKRHGNIEIFTEMPDDILIKFIIQPLLQAMLPIFSKTELTIIYKTLLDSYHFVNQHSLINQLTPRNLQMMCWRIILFYKTYQKYFPEQNKLTNIAWLSSYDEIRYILDKKIRKEFQNSAPGDFKKTKSVLKSQVAQTNLFNQYYFSITNSRYNPLRLLENQLAIREIKQHKQEIAHLGTNGILIEGASGIGKSSLVINYLQAKGYQKGLINGEKSSQGFYTYYYVTPTQPKHTQDILLRAFQQGSIVVIDELNTLPIEEYLNVLMSGVDLSGNKSRNPGFFVIATQNPPTFKNRYALSPALMNRFYKLVLPDYSKQELFKILCNQGHNSQLVKLAIDQYWLAKNYAHKHHKQPIPTARNLFAFFTKESKASYDEVKQDTEELSKKF